jgi:hypothetical protein
VLFRLIAVSDLARHRVLRADDDDGRGPGCEHDGQGSEHYDSAHVSLLRWSCFASVLAIFHHVPVSGVTVCPGTCAPAD